MTTATSGSESRENRLLIVLADISGYTDLMVASQTAAMHGQILVTMLIESILEQVDIPLRLQEIEGDAVFLVAEHPGDEAGWRDACEQVAAKLTAFFAAFAAGIVEAEQSTICRCGVCKASEMRLKVIVHSGSAVFHQIRGRAQVSGVDVIKAHRLLKNSVASHEYVLLSDSAFRELGPSLDLEFAEGKERYEGLGEISTFVHFPAGREAAVRDFYAQSAGRLTLHGLHYAAWAIREEFRVLFSGVRHRATPGGPLRRSAYAAAWATTSPLVFLLLAIVSPLKLLVRRSRRA